jgi:hypothetical protein
MRKRAASRSAMRISRALFCFPQSGMVMYGQISPRHCERGEAIQTASAERFWIASLRSQ